MPNAHLWHLLSPSLLSFLSSPPQQLASTLGYIPEGQPPVPSFVHPLTRLQTMLGVTCLLPCSTWVHWGFLKLSRKLQQPQGCAHPLPNGHIPGITFEDGLCPEQSLRGLGSRQKALGWAGVMPPKGTVAEMCWQQSPRAGSHGGTESFCGCH